MGKYPDAIARWARLAITLIATFIAWQGIALAHAQSTTQPDVALQLFTEELPPLNYRENGHVTGLSVELVREIQRRLGNASPLQVVPWARGYHALQEQANVALFSTARSAEREAQFQWVGPLANLDFVFYKRTGSPLVLDDLEDARRLGAIATYRDDVREQFLVEHGFTNLDSSTKLVSGARKLLEGRVDAWLDSNLSAPRIVTSLGHSPQAIERLLVAHSEPLYIAFSRSTPRQLVARWQRTLDDMARDGTFARMHRRWLPNQPLPERMARLSPAPGLATYPLSLYTEELPPLSFLRSGEPTGLSVDIVREIQRRLGHQAPIEVVPWSRGYQMALDAPDVALFSTVRDTDREPLFQWVGPLGSMLVHLYGLREANLSIDSLEEARRIGSIGTYQDDFGEQYLRKHGFTNLYGHRSASAIARNLVAGRIQLWVSGEPNAREIIAKSGAPASAFEPVYTLYDVSYYIAFSTETPHDVVALWQQTLDAMVEDGTLKRLRQQWQAAPAGDPT